MSTGLERPFPALVLRRVIAAVGLRHLVECKYFLVLYAVTTSQIRSYSTIILKNKKHNGKFKLHRRRETSRDAGPPGPLHPREKERL